MKWLLQFALLFCLGCGNDAAPAPPAECPAGVLFGSCEQGDACIEWGYSPQTFATLSGPGAANCPLMGGTWSDAACADSGKTAGCLTVGGGTCAVVWLAPSDNLAGEKQLCEVLLAGRWVTPESDPSLLR